MSSRTPANASPTVALLTWKDPVKSGYLGLLASAAVEYASKLVTGEGLVSKYKPTSCFVSNKLNDEILPKFGKTVSHLLPEVQSIVFSNDVETTLKSAGFAYILYKFTSWFSLYTLGLFAVIIAFTAPAIYFANQKEIDAAVHKYGAVAQEKIVELKDTASKKVAPHVETLVKKTGPIGSFISSKIPTRTAGSTVNSKKPFASKVEAAADKTDAAGEFNFQPSAKSTGASQFPDVPSTFKDDLTAAVNEVKSTTSEVKSSIPEPSL